MQSKDRTAPFMLASIVTLTMAMLMFQILQTIVLSLLIFHRNAFLVVSLAMLGLGSGGSVATLAQRLPIRKPHAWLWFGAFGFALSMLLSVVALSRSHSLPILIIAGLTPYFFVGLFLSVVFLSWPRQANRNYFFDLLGSGLGYLVLMALLGTTHDAGRTVLLVAEMGLLSALFIAPLVSRSRIVLSVAAMIGVAALFPATDRLFPFTPHSTKRYGEMLENTNIQSEIDWSRWGYLGRLDSVRAGGALEEFVAGRLVKHLQNEGAEFRYLFASGDNWSFTVDFKGNEPLKREFVREAIASAPYAFHDSPEVLNIGLGGGVDVFLALQNGAASVTGVEINPLMIYAAAERHRAYFDDAFHDPRVTILPMDGRTFVDKIDKKYDVITLTAVDTGAGLASGANLLSENYLYTQEAFDRYFQILDDEGVLFILRPEIQLVRCMATAAQTLKAMGEPDPQKHFVVLEPAGGRSLNSWIATVISRKPWTAERLARLEARLDQGDFLSRFHYRPDKEVGQGMIPLYFKLLETDQEDQFFDAMEVDMLPITDDRPYFYSVSRKFVGSDAGNLLLRVLAWVTAIGAALIFVPLLGLPKSGRSGRVLSTLGYFSGIGVGFMLVEICLIQKLVLYLGHPSYSITITLFSILVFAGLGSIVSGRLSPQPRRGHAIIFVFVIGAICAYSLGLDDILRFVQPESLWARCLSVSAILAPGSFFMGMPFPIMIRSMSGPEEALIPWAWGINAFASVGASVVATILAMTVGFSSLLLLGAAAYMFTLLLFLRRVDAAGP